MSVINREEVVKECKLTGKSVESVLLGMLENVSSVRFETYHEVSNDVEEIDRRREDFLHGGFGEVEETNVTDSDFDIAEEFFQRENKETYIINVLQELISDELFTGEVFATKREETQRYYVLEANKGLNNKPNNVDLNAIGLLVGKNVFEKFQNKDVVFEGYDFYGTFINGSWLFYRTDEARSSMTLKPFDRVTKIFSRNAGLLESEIMLPKKVLIAGAGSVGSLFALELARGGVGKFVLTDPDTLEIHNICRHQLGWKDVGRYKVDAVKDAILNINPDAEVTVFHDYLQEMPKEYLEGVNMIIGTGDNREANAFANDLAAILKVPFVNTGCWQRAHAGEVFYWYPDAGLPLYRKAFSKLISDDRAASHANYFAEDGDENNLNFEPGVCTDIAFVTMIAIKLCYDLLNKDEEGYTPRVLDYLRNYTIVCNTNKACIGGPNAEIFPHPLFISNNLVVGVDR